jgi:hypothetical protein
MPPMKYPLSFLIQFISWSNSTASIKYKQDTLLKKENVALVLDNGFSLVGFSVSGDLYVTKDVFIFHPKPYRGSKYEMHNNLVNDIILPYETIIKAKKATFLGGGLKIKTKDKTYKIAIASTLKQLPEKKLRATVALINKLIKEHVG